MQCAQEVLKFLPTSDALHLPVGVTHAAHAGSAPVAASLIFSVRYSGQYANLSCSTSPVPAEKFDGCPCIRAAAWSRR